MEALFEWLPWLGQIVRVGVILLGFAAMWALWVARRERKHLWSSKMKDIWLCHFLFVCSTISANTEQLYRGQPPVASLALIGFIYIWTVKGTFNGEFYIVEPHIPPFDDPDQEKRD